MKQQPYIVRRVAAELVGTYALVSAGCGAIIVNSLTGVPSHVGVALTFDLIIGSTGLDPSPVLAWAH